MTEKYYVPSNITVVVVGDVEAEAMERVARSAFPADRPAAAALKLPPDEFAGETPVRRVISTPFRNGFVGLAYPAPSVKDDPEVYAMDVLLTLLENGGTGRLPRALKDRAGVDASFETRRQAGLLTVIAATGPDNVEAIEALLRKELDFVSSQPVPEAELSLAKRALRGQYVMDGESYSGQAGTLGYYAVIDRWQFASSYLARVEAVTAEQVRALAKKYLNSERLISVILKPGAAPRRNPAPPMTGA